MTYHEDIPDVDLEELKDVATKHVLDELEKPIKLTKISDDEEVMMASVVGDDVLQDDPTVKQLEEKIAKMCGM